MRKESLNSNSERTSNSNEIPRQLLIGLELGIFYKQEDDADMR